MCRAPVLTLSLIISATVIIFFGMHCFSSMKIHSISATRTSDHIVEDIDLARLIGTVATVKDQLCRFKIRFADESFMRIFKHKPFFLWQTDLFLYLEGLDLCFTVYGIADIILIAENRTYRGA